MTQNEGGSGGNKPVVLIVEDERGLAELYGRWLSEHFETRIAYDGFEAWEMLDDSVDVILLDRRMPGMSGDELLERIRDSSFEGRIAFLSGVEPEEEIAEMPVDEYLTKPVERERLADAVEALLLRSGVDAAKQELLALISRKRTLEEKNPRVELEESETFQKLREKISTAIDSGGFSTHRVRSKYRPDECPECNLRWDIAVDGTVGFLRLGSNVWECARCGEVVFYSDPSDRRVARR